MSGGWDVSKRSPCYAVTFGFFIIRLYPFESEAAKHAARIPGAFVEPVVLVDIPEGKARW